MANVTYQHDDYSENYPLWELVDDVCEGEACVKEKGVAYLPKPNPTDMSPENAARYEQYKARAVFYNVTGRTLTGLTGESYTYPLDEEFADCGGTQTHLRIELYSERDGLESWQSHSHRFERVYTGFGHGFGNNWGE